MLIDFINYFNKILSLPNDHVSFYQPSSSKMAGTINPRKLIKAQHKIAASKYGCKLIDGQVDKVTRLRDHYENNATEMFILDVMKYSDAKQLSSDQQSKNGIQIRAKRIILANGVYTNIIPLLKVYSKSFELKVKSHF